MPRSSKQPMSSKGREDRKRRTQRAAPAREAIRVIRERLAAAGFAKSSAQTLCRSVKGKGGGCIAYASSRPLPGAIDVVDTGMRVAAR